MRLAMVVPRYGPDILGGAETFARVFAEEMTRRGYGVDVLTTCGRDHITWRNELPAGRTTINGITVERFPIRANWDSPRYHALHGSILSGQSLTIDEQYEWIDTGAHSPALYAHIQRHQYRYDLLIFVPYLFPTTYYGASIAPDKSIIWPCLHDEGYAWLAPTRAILQTVRGVMFNVEPERQLAHRLGVQNAGEAIVGFGLQPVTGSAARFRQATGIEDPFVLYSGRLEGAKNVPRLVGYFLDYKRERGGPLKLVLMGTGPEAIPAHRDIIQLGFRQGQDKFDAYAAASILCQPSVNESFSIVIMESWQASVPVLVHGNCAVTKYHARQSGGGLYFLNYADFSGALDLVLGDDELRAHMGQNGCRYVAQNYNWEAVAGRFEVAVARWQQPAAPVPVAV
jgi:glycosyltransferase involved in cell wall biosynthesis